jgi:hypothetical protein
VSPKQAPEANLSLIDPLPPHGAILAHRHLDREQAVG